MTTLTERYSDSLFHAAQSLDCLRAVDGELVVMKDLLFPFGRFLQNPRISADELTG